MKIFTKKKMDAFAKLPENYDTYIFDLYGTLVDIRTDEGDKALWEKLALFYGYYDAIYTADEIEKRYKELVSSKEKELKLTLEDDPHYSHEASPEIEITEVFKKLFLEKGVTPTEELAVHAGQLFRVVSTMYVKTYPGTEEMLAALRAAKKKVYLLSNAQRIFTEYEMHVLQIAKYFDGIFISSDYKTKKPDPRFFDALINEYNIDIKGAKTVDLDTFYVKSNISPDGDFAEDATFAVDNFVGWTV